MLWKKIFVFALGLLIGMSSGALTRVQGFSSPSLMSFVSDASIDYRSTDADEERVLADDVFVNQPRTPDAIVLKQGTGNGVRIPVMIYHSVRPHIKGESQYQDAYDITPELLERELKYIVEEGYTTISFRDVTNHWILGTPLPEKPVILSFDDGWKNEFAHALPLLQKYHCTATFFVFTNPIDNEKPHWMSWDDVRALDKAGMEIGGHSRTHPVLTKIKTDVGLDNEIGKGKAIIEEKIGHPITAFAYPFGSSNAQVESAVTRAGYLVARTVISGVHHDSNAALEFNGTLATDNFNDFTKLLTTPQVSTAVP
jgi:peptidoglycan/xylan/chitin deacetylase (PgdA/CDA1 family)